MAISKLHSLTEHIPTGQFGRYLLVGVANTMFAYASFALFTFLLAGVMPASYLAGILLSRLVNITVSFLGYKWFVFRTRGNYLREWGRCLVIYSGAIAFGILVLPPVVYLVRYLTGRADTAPYIAGALVLGAKVIISFFGHRNFSFRPLPERGADGGS